MTGVSGTVVLAHGSRAAEQRVVVTTLTAMAQHQDDAPWRTAFLDHHGPTLDDAVSSLVAGGCHRIVVVPALLSSAFHAGVDVPAAIDRLDLQRAVQVVIAEPLGPDAALFAVVARHRDDAVTAGLIGPQTHLVVAAAGTSDAVARADFTAAVARWSATSGWVATTAAFMAGGEPDVASAVSDALREGSDVALAPFVLADGVLSRRAHEQATSCGVDVVLPCLGAAPEIAAILVARRDACATV